MAGSSNATLQLNIKAKNMAGPALAKLRVGIKGIGHAALTAARVGFAALTAAALAATAALGGAIKGAIDEQTGIVAMGQALKDNVKGFDGNTAAIERLISRREKLGFSDDALRSSMTFLVTKFKDVGVAGRVQGTAMDVARLKGISLEAATKLVSRAMDGNKRALKELGIQLPDTASKQQRLAAIQGVAAGQAEEYGKTTKGAMESAQIAIGDAAETIGAAFLPMVKDMATWLTDHVGPAADTLAGIMQNNIVPALKDFATWAGDHLLPTLQDVAKWVGENVVPKVLDLWDTFGKASTAVAGVVGPIVGSLVPAMESIFVAVFGGKKGGHNGRESDGGGLMGAFGRLAAALWGNGEGALPSALKGLAKVFNENVAPVISGMVTLLTTLIDKVTWAVGLLEKLMTLLRSGREAMEAAGWTRPDNVPAWIAPGQGVTGPPKAGGGWVGLHGPEMVKVGENGPEFVMSRGMMGSGAGSTMVAVPVSERELLGMVDRGMYFKLRRAGTAA